jgi:hypothetical protein
MKRYLPAIITLFITLGLALPLPAASVPNLVGQFGFNWLRPDKSKCAEVTSAIQASFKSCEYSDPKSTKSFAGKGDFYMCKAGEQNEFIIYKTKARCAEEYGIMESNAP